MKALVLKNHAVQVAHVVPNGLHTKEHKTLVLTFLYQQLSQIHIVPLAHIQAQQIVNVTNAQPEHIKI